MYTLEFDGMLRTMDEVPIRTGILGYGWLFSRDGTEIAYGFGLFYYRGSINSTQAEYMALSEGLEAIRDLDICDEFLQISGDARCVIEQMTGTASVSAVSTKKVFKRARKLAASFQNIAWRWVPRHENKLADRLSRRGLARVGLNGMNKLEFNKLYYPRLNSMKLVPIADLTTYYSHLIYSDN